MVARNIKEIRIIDLRNQVSETATTENNILSERRYSDRSSKCLGRLRILIWKAENASGGKGILLNSGEVKYICCSKVVLNLW